MRFRLELRPGIWCLIRQVFFLKLNMGCYKPISGFVNVFSLQEFFLTHVFDEPLKYFDITMHRNIYILHKSFLIQMLIEILHVFLDEFPFAPEILGDISVFIKYMNQYLFLFELFLVWHIEPVVWIEVLLLLENAFFRAITALGLWWYRMLILELNGILLVHVSWRVLDITQTRILVIVLLVYLWLETVNKLFVLELLIVEHYVWVLLR